MSILSFVALLPEHSIGWCFVYVFFYIYIFLSQHKLHATLLYIECAKQRITCTKLLVDRRSHEEQNFVVVVVVVFFSILLLSLSTTRLIHIKPSSCLVSGKEKHFKSQKLIGGTQHKCTRYIGLYFFSVCDLFLSFFSVHFVCMCCLPFCFVLLRIC